MATITTKYWPMHQTDYQKTDTVFITGVFIRIFSTPMTRVRDGISNRSMTINWRAKSTDLFVIEQATDLFYVVSNQRFHAHDKTRHAVNETSWSHPIGNNLFLYENPQSLTRCYFTQPRNSGKSRTTAWIHGCRIATVHLAWLSLFRPADFRNVVMFW